MISSGLTYLSIMHRSGNDVFNPINSIFLWLHSEISTDVNSFYSLICFSYHTYQSEDNIISAYLYLFSIFFYFLISLFQVGDGPHNRYALICKQCQSHNGMALREEFEFIAYRCCYCHYWNPARKQKPTAPRLEASALLRPQVVTESSSDEEGKGLFVFLSILTCFYLLRT